MRRRVFATTRGAHRGDVAAMRGAPTLPQREEFAKGMVRWCRRNVVATRGAPTTPKGEDSAMGMENEKVDTLQP